MYRFQDFSQGFQGTGRHLRSNRMSGSPGKMQYIFPACYTIGRPFYGWLVMDGCRLRFSTDYPSLYKPSGSGFFSIPISLWFIPSGSCSLLAPIQDRLCHHPAILPVFFPFRCPCKAAGSVYSVIINAVTSHMILPPIRSFPGNHPRSRRSLLRFPRCLPAFS